MARVPEGEIERRKREVSLEGLVRGAGIELARHGADLLGLCPFHEDREPSLVVSPKKNMWHCLGACQTGGSVIDWVMRTKSVSFRHAVEILRGAPLQPARRLPAPLTLETDGREALRQVVGNAGKRRGTQGNAGTDGT